MWRSGPPRGGSPLRGVRQAAVHAAHAQAAHGAAAPAAAALGALRPVPQGVPHAQLAQQPQEHLPPPPARPAAAAAAAGAARAARARLQAAPAPRHRLLQVQGSVQRLSRRGAVATLFFYRIVDDLYFYLAEIIDMLVSRFILFTFLF